jgi:nitroimidazol reductase NimA-like FMN-containing flavoprotein (pyridoxamine 5'-phosphate oxidase superfamily)
MIGKLSPSEIEDVLSLQCVGRIGCHDKDNIYVVPISYAYDGENIYCHGYEGKKIELMRMNPGVCFEVDEMKDMANWKSVILQGQFEEINDKKERDKALEILVNRRLPISSSITTHLGQTWPFVGDGFKGLSDIPGIVFRISIQEKTGRFEKTSLTPLESA